MANRTSARRMIPGNPVEGMLRGVTRGVRSTSRGRRGMTGPQGATGATGPAGPPGQSGENGTSNAVAMVLQSGADGVAVWQFSPPLAAAPVVTATPSAAPDGVAVIASVASVSQHGLKVLLQSQDPATGLFVPHPGGQVHVVAAASTPPADWTPGWAPPPPLTDSGAVE